MYVKIVHPHTRSTLTFEVHGEVYYQKREAMTHDEIQSAMAFFEELHHDVRRYAVWPNDPQAKIEVTEITLPSSRGQAPIVIFTNHNCWLINERGDNLDRLHRYQGAE